jgi:hypothetical protein
VRRTRNLVCAARRRTSSQRDTDREHLAVGSAVRAAMSQWAAQQTQDFLQIAANMQPYYPGSSPSSTDIKDNDTTRAQLILWGVVACTLAMHDPKWRPELTAACSFLNSRQRKYALDTLGEHEALGQELADEAERQRWEEGLDSGG